MQYESSYPAPVYGVSTLAPRDRKNGLAEEQINFRSDPVQKLTRRPSLEWVRSLGVISEGLQNHEYARKGNKVRILILASGSVKAYINDVEKPVSGNISSYVSGAVGNLVLKTVNDTTFVVNRNKIVTMLPTTDRIERVVHINVTAALNYGESVTIFTGTTRKASYTYQVPDLGMTPNYDAADRARATNAVATALADLINADPLADVTARASGSSVAIWKTSANDAWATVEVSAGQGDRQIIAVNQVIEDIAGLPKYAVHGTRIKVQPNPTSGRGVYYLSAQGTDPNAAIPPSLVNRFLQEVVWTESRAPDERFRIDPTTMPVTIVYNSISDSFSVGIPSVGWSDRITGDNGTCKVPAFVGRTIEHLGYFQKRLVLLSENSVIMSRTDDLFNFWRQSAVSLLVTDPVSIDASTTDVDKLNFITNHNRDLLILSRNNQLKISGDVPVTPETISMPVVTSFDISVTAEPTNLGNAVMIPIKHGSSSGVIRYEREQDKEQDNAIDISSHCVGLLNGDIDTLISNSNLETVIVKTTTSRNKLYVFEQFTYAKENLQLSWSTWEFEVDILSLAFQGTEIYVLYRTPWFMAGVVHVGKITVNETANWNNVYLDNKIIADAVGNEVTVPAEYNSRGCVVVSLAEGSTGLKYNTIPFYRDGNTLVIERTLSTTPYKVAVGLLVTCSYTPTRPFRRDQEGRVITSDSLRVNRFVIHAVDTGKLELHTKSKYFDHDPQVFTARELGDFTSKLGERAVFTGDITFPFEHVADLATPVFKTNDYLGVTISGISWVGQYHQRVRRM